MSIIKEIHELSDEELKERAPVIFGREKHDSKSERFQLFGTAKMLKMLKNDFGLLPVSAVASSKHREHGYHSVSLRKKEDILTASEMIKKGIPHIFTYTLTNSNGAGSVALRLARSMEIPRCENGLMISDEVSEHFRIPHQYHSEKEVLSMAKKYFKSEDTLREKIEFWKRRKLTDEQISKFGMKALELRLRESILEENKGLLPQVIKPLRRDNDSLFDVYNDIEERLVKGNVSYDNGKRVLPIKGFSKMRFELNLNKIANEFSKKK